MRHCLALVAIAAASCAGPKPDPAEAKFRAAVAAYVDEARALTKFLREGAPDYATAMRRAGEVTDLYTRVPDRPAAFDDVRGLLAVSQKHFRNATGFLETAHSYAARGDQKHAAETLAHVRKSCQSQAEILDAVDGRLAP
jgi:hypothetical protein